VIDARDLAPVTPIEGEITIVISPAPTDIPPALADATERRWAELLADNPRLHDGSILAIERFDPATNTIRARRDGYKRLAVQPQAPTDVRLLSVTGMITALDERERPCVLLGRRSTQTRLHGGLWELAPAGGIDAPKPGVSTIGADAVRAQLQTELREELGLDLDVSLARPIALVVEGPGCSVDIVMRLDTGVPITALDMNTDSWEYTGARWVAIEQASEFASRHAAELIPSTHNMLRAID
jgi:8-oxo-dGTP pyrophosphatase MutT (NUDIX family)